MNPRSLMLLLGATLVVVLVTIFMLRSSESAVRGKNEEAKLFPELMARINDAATIEIARKDTTTTLQKNGGAWGLAQKSAYPVDVEPIAKALIALAEMTTVEPKTSDPTRYEKLGVEDAGAESDSSLVTIKDAGGQVIASLIVGKSHEGKRGVGSGQLYVRKPGEAQSWLVEGTLDLKEKPEDWLAEEILKVPRDRIRSIVVTHPAGTEGAAGDVVRVDRAKPEDANFTLHDIPEGKELTYPTVAGAMANALEWLNLEDVVPAGEVDFAQEAGAVARFDTFDGLVLTIKTKDQDGKTFARFEASYEAPPADPSPPAEEKQEGEAEAAPATSTKKTPEEVQKEVADLNLRLSPWAFVIPAYNRSTFAKKMSELVKDVAPPAPPSDEFGAPGSGDDETFKIPDNLPPEIQEQIKKDLESKGHKSEVIPAPPAPADEHAGHDHPPGEHPSDPPKDESTPPQ